MFSTLKKLFAKNETRVQAQAQYIACVKQARHPYFYAELGVPDSLDGRFEMILLHLVLHLARNPELSAEQQRFLLESFFADMERNIREFGVDMGVKRRIRAMADAYNGRNQAYIAALAQTDNDLLQQALRRNVYGTVTETDIKPENIAKLADYCRAPESISRGI
jgi:cytochrome b pre-mRNA-processing protein 3